jgi:hypothetical protein
VTTIEAEVRIKGGGFLMGFLSGAKMMRHFPSLTSIRFG